MWEWILAQRVKKEEESIFIVSNDSPLQGQLQTHTLFTSFVCVMAHMCA